MEQIECLSWKTLDALKTAATHVEEVIGDLDTHEQMSVFMTIEDDYFELFYSEVEANYLRHFDDEEEMLRYLEQRKAEIGDDEFESGEYYEDDDEFKDEDEDELNGYKISGEDEDDDF